MKIEIAEKWVKALRSGEYIQAKGRLKKGDGFCCLGVLSEIYNADTGMDYSKSEYYQDKVSIDRLCPDVCRWSGLKSDMGFLPSRECLSTLNDEGKSFSEIANVIEQNVSAL